MKKQVETRTSSLSLSVHLLLLLSCRQSKGEFRGRRQRSRKSAKMVVITIENPAVTFAGLMGNLFSALVVLAPVSTFYRILKNKSTESFQSVPYVVGLFSAMMWTYYGLLTSDVLLLSINVGVCLLEVIYLTIFLVYAPRKAKVYTVKLILLVNVGVVAGLVLISFLLIKGKRRAQITGGICASFAVSVFVAPLSIIRLVIRTKSVEYMPFTLSFFLTLSAIAWLSYGVLIHDMFVALPNVLGFLFGMAQIILYLMYMNYNKGASATKVPKLSDNNEVEVEARTVDIELPEKKSVAPMSSTPVQPAQCAPLQVPDLGSHQFAQQVMVEV